VAIVLPTGHTVDEVERLGVVTQRYGTRVVVAGLREPEAAELHTAIPGAVVFRESGSLPAAGGAADLTDAEALGLAAFDLRRCAAYPAAKEARPLAGESWETPLAQPPRPPQLPPSNTNGAPAALAGTSDRLLGSVAVGLVIVEGPSNEGSRSARTSAQKRSPRFRTAWAGLAVPIKPRA
jgi:hypothetical protein